MHYGVQGCSDGSEDGGGRVGGGRAGGTEFLWCMYWTALRMVVTWNFTCRKGAEGAEGSRGCRVRARVRRRRWVQAQMARGSGTSSSE